MAYPSTLSTLATPQPTDRLNSPSHSTLHQNENAAILEIERAVGLDSSVLGTIIGDLRNASSNGGGHIQTANKGGTGQTTYSKGDVLVGQSSSVLTKLAVGADQTVLVADSSQITGVKWGAAPTTNVQSFISTGIWVKPTAATATSRVLVELWGAGGSGAAGSGTTVAGGGGGGAYMSGWYGASILSASVMVGVGVGGASVVANSVGVAGTNTVFDTQNSVLTAYSGYEGSFQTNSGGGGGGGGLVGGGSGGSGTNGGSGGQFLIGTQAGSSTGGNGGSAGSVGGYIGSAGAGGGGGGSGAAGGAALFGGGGGGGVTSSAFGLGGVSGAAGSGSRGSVVGGGTGAPGGFPGGGSGGVSGVGAKTGQGGNGKAVITTFL